LQRKKIKVLGEKMAWDPGWEELFQKHEWGKYPPEDLIRFIAKNFYKYQNRDQISILEIGCGPGGNLWYLAREGFHAVGIDGSRTAIQKAQSRMAKESLFGGFFVGDVVTLPFRNTIFDAVIDIECLYANTESDTRKILKEIHRVLKPGGKLFSKTFMVGMVKPEDGVSFPGENNTYRSVAVGPLSAKVGVQRLTSEANIADLYSIFTIESIDYLIRSEGNRHSEVREFLISCKK
jgi:SAM-dependent methyltransferase